jgi:hypothetical protein
MRATRRALRSTVRTASPNAVMRSRIAAELVPSQSRSGAERVRHHCEVCVPCAAGNDGGLMGLWRGAVDRPSDPNRPYSSHQHYRRHDARPLLPRQSWHLLPNPHAQRSPRLGILSLRPVPEPKEGSRLIIAMGDGRGRGQRRHVRRLACGHWCRGRSSVTPQPALGAGQAQRGPRSLSAIETPAQTLPGARCGLRIGMAPVERRRRRGSDHPPFSRCRAPGAACDLPGQALGLVPVILGRSRVRRDIVEVQRADRRERRRLVRSASPTRVVVHGTPKYVSINDVE